jgi:hypothetical protein
MSVEPLLESDTALHQSASPDDGQTDYSREFGSDRPKVVEFPGIHRDV